MAVGDWCWNELEEAVRAIEALGDHVEKRDKAICWLAENGWSLREIAPQAHLSHEAVRQIVKRGNE